MKNVKYIFQCILLIFYFQTSVKAWEPPIGIPAPDFGIEEDYRMYDNPANRNPALTYTQNTEGGYYTHYVDNTHPAATDDANPYGNASMPMRTIPTDLAAGSIVEIHGGPYTNSIIIQVAGTSVSPAFIRGPDKDHMPVISSRIRPVGYYLILEYLEFDGGYLQFDDEDIQPNNQDFMSFRHSEMKNGNGIIMQDTARDIVIYDNHIHHNGDWQNLVDIDPSGLEIGGSNTKRVWIVDNQINYNGSDGIQTFGGDPEYIYIGRNVMHHNRENAIDNKVADHCIISQNTFYGYYIPPGDASSFGDAIRINDEGTTDNTWILFNDIYDCLIGIETNGATPQSLYVIGNKIYNLGAEGDSGIGASDGWGQASKSVVNNVVYNFSKGITENRAAIANNIVSQASDYHIEGDIEIRNNIMWQKGDSITTLGVTPVDCIEEDPLFVDAENGDFRLKSDSPAIDKGVVSDVYRTFYDLYGIDIKKDIENKKRPLDGDESGTAEWDIGVYEYGKDLVNDNSNINIGSNSNISISNNNNQVDSNSNKAQLKKIKGGCSCDSFQGPFAVILLLMGFIFRRLTR